MQFVNWLKEKDPQLADEVLSEKNWLKDAVNPDHKGFCTPMSKATWTPKRKALAKRFKKGGDIHADNEKK